MNILIVRTDKLGDFITTLPAISSLKTLMPQAKISVLVSPLNKILAQSCPFIDNVILDENESLWQLSKKLKAAHYDLSFTLFSNTRVALAQFLAQIPVRYAPATKIAQIFYTHRIKQRRSQVKMSEYEYNMDLIRHHFKALPAIFDRPLLECSKQNDPYTDFKKQFQIDKEVIAFHPGFGGSSDANWSLEEYFELAEQVAKMKKYQLIFTFGPDETELLEKARKLKGDKDMILYPSKGSVVDFACLIRHFKLFISTSTGTYHLAALVNTATMTFFGDSLFASVKRWKAVSESSLQHPFMLPSESQKRTEVFKEVKKELLKLL